MVYNDTRELPGAKERLKVLIQLFGIPSIVPILISIHFTNARGTVGEKYWPPVQSLPESIQNTSLLRFFDDENDTVTSKEKLAEVSLFGHCLCLPSLVSTGNFHPSL